MRSAGEHGHVAIAIVQEHLIAVLRSAG